MKVRKSDTNSDGQMIVIKGGKDRHQNERGKKKKKKKADIVAILLTAASLKHFNNFSDSNFL